MKNLISVFGVFCLMSYSTVTFSQSFLPQTSGVSNVLNGINFLDDNTGIAVGYGGVIVTTTNGGTTWTPRTSGVSKDVLDAVFINSTTVIACGRSGVILKSVNGGVTWSPLSSGVITDLTRIHINGNDWYISGYNGVLLKSTDQGTTWNPLNTGTTTPLFEPYFTSSTVGYVVGNTSTILKTTDGGESWTPMTSNVSTSFQFISLHFTDANHGYAVGGCRNTNQAVKVQTTDAGATWTPQIYANNYFGGIHFLNTTTGFIAGGDVVDNTSTILKTIDAGVSWTVQPSISSRQMSVACPSFNTGYTCGLNGTILKTTNINVGIDDFVTDVAFNNASITVFPNPTSGLITICFDVPINSEDFTIEVYSVSGERVLSQEKENAVDLSNFTNGPYVLKVQNGTAFYAKKVIKE